MYFKKIFVASEMLYSFFLNVLFLKAETISLTNTLFQ